MTGPDNIGCTCQHCRFFSGQRDYAFSGGCCHRRAPKTFKTDTGIKTYWPQTSGDKWCGEWELSKESDPTYQGKNP